MTNVSFIKLSSGEEIYGEITNKGERSVTITNPLYLERDEDDESVACHWCYLSKERTFRIAYESMMFPPTQVLDDIVEQYTEFFADEETAGNEGIVQMPTNLH